MIPGPSMSPLYAIYIFTSYLHSERSTLCVVRTYVCVYACVQGHGDYAS